MSTLLISDKEDYLSYNGLHQKQNQDSTIEIDTITIEKLIENENIDTNNISLIKIDIEGGEKILIPALENFLKKHKPKLFISLHRCFLKDNDIKNIVNILFNIYDKCFFFNYSGNKTLVTKFIVNNNKLNTLVFE